MIKVFRKIRQNLLSENNIGKYLAYAIGEIILVVIGILIALQIGNINEERKKRAQGGTLKQALKTELKADLERIKADLKYIEDELKINVSYAERLSNPNSNLDTLVKIVRHEYFFGFYGVSELDNTTFRSLESTGTISLIGKDLANSVQKYYRDREDNISVINSNLEVYFDLIEPLVLEYPADSFVIKGRLQEKYWQSADLNKLYAMFNGILTTRIFNLTVRKRILKESIDKTQSLILKLD